MRQRLRVHELPLLASGLPEALESWLRLAGVPVSPFGSRYLRAHPGEEASARLLLFDSRVQDACADARSAHERGLRVLDTAAIWEVGAIPQGGSRNQRTNRSRLLERLKSDIERSGGIWMRLADYPFPYQSAVCYGTESAGKTVSRFAGAFEPVPTRFAETAPVACRRVSDSTYLVDRTSEEGAATQENPTGDDIETWVRRRCTQGLPFVVHDAAPSIEGDVPFDTRRFPLLWQTTFEEFANWWQRRAEIAFRARCRGNVFQIECDDELGDCSPMLELWRGQHVASFPLRCGTMTVREDGLVFAQEHHRHPAGFAPLWAETERPARNKVQIKSRSA